MSNWIDKIKPVPRRAKLREVVTREWVEAVQCGLLELAQGEHLDVGYGVVKSLGHGKVRLDLRAGRMDVAPAAEAVPLHIIDARPSYIPVPASPPAEGVKRFYIEWGTLGNKLADNWQDYHDITETTYFFAKAYLRATDTLAITSWEILTGTVEDAYEMPDWAVGAARPAYAICLLGSVQVVDGGASIVNSGGGSLNLTEHITIIQQGSGAGEVLYGKQLVFTRLTY